jgi:hypothetical protein
MTRYPVILSTAKDLAAVSPESPYDMTRYPVILSTAKDLAAGRDRPFAEFTLERSEGLKVTSCD